MRILILDDSARAIAELGAVARELGADVTTAATAEAARGALEGQRVDLWLVDPAIAGAVDLLRELRGAGNEVEVLLVTAGLKPAALAELFKLRVAEYVSKPVRREEARDKVKKLLERRKKQRSAAASAPGSAALDARPERDVLLAIGDDAERARVAALLGEVSHVDAVDAAAIARRGRLYACRAVVVDPRLLGADWPAYARAARGDSLLVSVGDPAGIGVDLVLARPVVDVGPLLAALAADADPLLMSGNVLTVQRGAGSVDRWFRRVGDELSMSIGGLGMAKTPYAIVDLAAAPREAERLGALVAQAFEWAADAGMRLAVVGPAELKAMLDDTAAAKVVPFFETIALAREAGKYFEEG